MYAQNPRGTNLPRNYSGNAFRNPPIRTEEEPLVEQEPVQGSAVDELTPPEKETPTPSGGVASDPRTRLLSFGGRGIGSEELLLLGMLLLLGGGEGQSELMMCLLILLFCG